MRSQTSQQQRRAQAWLPGPRRSSKSARRKKWLRRRGPGRTPARPSQSGCLLQRHHCKVMAMHAAGAHRAMDVSATHPGSRRGCVCHTSWVSATHPGSRRGAAWMATAHQTRYRLAVMLRKPALHVADWASVRGGIADSAIAQGSCATVPCMCTRDSGATSSVQSADSPW
jgi:hypothetical protein